MNIPIVYYPLSILCIDDEEIMLKTLSNYISPKYPVITVTTPTTAYTILNKNQSKPKLANHLENIINSENSDSSDIQLKIRLEQLIGLSEIEDKSSEIGVMIVDYKLPEMNGLDFCYDIHNLSTMKILLTECQEYQRVLSAFSDNIIHSFFPKSENNLLSRILNCISQLTTRYFLNATQQLKANIETKNKLPISDDLFKKLFCSIIRDMEIREYYLLDVNGSFLFINTKQERFYLIVHTEESLISFTSLYNDSDLKPFIEPITNRLKIPFFGPKKDPAEVNISEWGTHLFTPQKFIGEKLYYWHIFKQEI